ncbi:MAG: hypothetical protein ACKKL5_02985 [Candidatus Komeilibacteria bacterium]
MKKIFLLAIILLIVNYFYGDRIDTWWQGWRSGAKVQELGSQAWQQVQGEASQYSADQLRQAAANLPDDIKLQIDNWLLSQDLNQYGDPQDTVYTGGTPTFDEATGQTTDRFQLILQKFPDLIDQFQLSWDQLIQPAEE